MAWTGQTQTQVSHLLQAIVLRATAFLTTIASAGQFNLQ
jgi:hypothetical protein